MGGSPPRMPTNPPKRRHPRHPCPRETSGNDGSNPVHRRQTGSGCSGRTRSKGFGPVGEAGFHGFVVRLAALRLIRPRMEECGQPGTAHGIRRPGTSPSDRWPTTPSCETWSRSPLPPRPTARACPRAEPVPCHRRPRRSRSRPRGLPYGRGDWNVRARHCPLGATPSCRPGRPMSVKEAHCRSCLDARTGSAPDARTGLCESGCRQNWGCRRSRRLCCWCGLPHTA